MISKHAFVFIRTSLLAARVLFELPWLALNQLSCLRKSVLWSLTVSSSGFTMAQSRFSRPFRQTTASCDLHSFNFFQIPLLSARSTMISYGSYSIFDRKKISLRCRLSILRLVIWLISPHFALSWWIGISGRRGRDVTMRFLPLKNWRKYLDSHANAHFGKHVRQIEIHFYLAQLNIM